MVKINELEQLGLETLKDFFDLDNGFVENLSSKQVALLIKKASLGMQFFKEVNVGRRARENNTLRVCTLIADDKEELKRLLKVSLPSYYVEGDGKKK
jgi:hypothetical protein